MSDRADLLADLFGLAGRTAIVTGASKGLGAHFAEVLRSAGANVVVAARSIDALEARFGGRPGFLPVRCDVTHAADRAEVMRQTMETFGSLDVLVNNAAVTGPSVGPSASVDTFERVLDVDLIALHALSLLAAEVMGAQGRGSIVNISSMSGVVAVAPLDDHAYCAAKGAVVNLTRQLGASWMGRGIRVNSLAPGMFRSDMSERALATEGSKRLVRDECPAGRLGEVGELDAALLFLAGDGSSYVAGHTLLVDGGFTAR